jgi:hypothetical protein
VAWLHIDISDIFKKSIPLPTGLLTYSQAAANCKSVGGDLAQPTNDLESDTLTRYKSLVFVVVIDFVFLWGSLYAFCQSPKC